MCPNKTLNLSSISGLALICQLKILSGFSEVSNIRLHRPILVPHSHLQSQQSGLTFAKSSRVSSVVLWTLSSLLKPTVSTVEKLSVCRWSWVLSAPDTNRFIVLCFLLIMSSICFFWCLLMSSSGSCRVLDDHLAAKFASVLHLLLVIYLSHCDLIKLLEVISQTAIILLL